MNNMNTNRPKDILFWSPRCPYSKNLLDKIKNTPIIQNIQLFNIDDNSIPLPPFVKVVPTLITQQPRQSYTDARLDRWVEQQLQMLSQQQLQRGSMIGGAPSVPTHGQPNNANQPYQSGNYQQPQPKLKPVNESGDDLAKQGMVANPELFNPSEMNSGFSDTFSFIGDNEDKAVASHNFKFIGKALDTPPVTKPDIKAGDQGDFPTQNNQNSPNNQYQSNSYQSNQSTQYNPDEFNSYQNQPNPYQSNPMGQQMGQQMANQMTNMDYNPDPNQGHMRNSRRMEREEAFENDFESLVNKRNLEDSMSSLMR